jgi:hypothetical protein
MLPRSVFQYVAIVLLACSGERPPGPPSTTPAPGGSRRPPAFRRPGGSGGQEEGQLPLFVLEDGASLENDQTQTTATRRG